MQAIVKDDPSTRSRPKAQTANRIAEEFGVSLNDLYQDPIDCLRAAVEAFESAPITKVVEPPPVTLEKVKRAARKRVSRSSPARRVGVNGGRTAPSSPATRKSCEGVRQLKTLALFPIL
jgi:hypothetical protein